jgi:hypothetical protein
MDEPAVVGDGGGSRGGEKDAVVGCGRSTDGRVLGCLGTKVHRAKVDLRRFESRFSFCGHAFYIHGPIGIAILLATPDRCFNPNRIYLTRRPFLSGQSARRTNISTGRCHTSARTRPRRSYDLSSDVHRPG